MVPSIHSHLNIFNDSMNMRQIILLDKHNIELREVPAPTAEDLGPNQVLIKVRRIGVCGSEIHSYHGEPSTSKVLKLFLLLNIQSRCKSLGCSDFLFLLFGRIGSFLPHFPTRSPSGFPLKFRASFSLFNLLLKSRFSNPSLKF